MIAVDTQILVYAHRAETPWHLRARARVTELAQSQTRWAIPMHCLIELYANVTNARLYAPASTPAQATSQIDAWLEAPTVEVLTEGAQTWPMVRSLLVAAKIVAAHAYDARIAAVCLQYGVTELWTNDRDFLRFPALRVRNPLIDVHPTAAGESRAGYQLQSRSHSASRGARTARAPKRTTRTRTRS